jgi:large subunit ribosomal protein L3
MEKAILARKIGMTQIFAENGALIPVTVLEAGPCLVVQKKTVENDGYTALQVGFEGLKQKHAKKPLKGHYEARLGNVNTAPNKVIKEFRLENPDQFEVGSEIKADIFSPGEYVDISGTSKGKGYQGAIKRHGQSRGPMSHGSKYHRGLGSMGPGTTPGSVKKGKKMPGHMGAKRVTVQNLEIVRADGEKNLLLVRGAVPGIRGALLTIKSTVKR